MPEYQLEVKQLVDYPRCRIYRQFIESLIADRSFHSRGGSGLFYFTVLCSYTNFRSSYQRIEKVSYVVHPGEWICSLSELTGNFRLKYQHQALQVLEHLQRQNYITFTRLAHGKVIKYRITDWQKSNTVLDYNAPCQKDTGFFFFPVSAVGELVGMGKCSELDIILDMWLNTVSKTQIRAVLSKAAEVLYLQGIPCCRCRNARYKLYPYPGDCREKIYLSWIYPVRKVPRFIVLNSNDHAPRPAPGLHFRAKILSKIHIQF